MSPRLPVPAADRTPETEEFWAAVDRHQLILRRCDACGTVIWYPRSRCPGCGDTAVSWVPASGRGTVYSFTVVHRSPSPYRDAVPYVVAYVELAEGPRIVTNVVGCEPESVHIGQDVTVVFEDSDEGRALYRFAPSDGR